MHINVAATFKSERPKVTTQMTGPGEVELVVDAFQLPQGATVSLAARSWNGCDWTVMETKLGMQMMNVTT